MKKILLLNMLVLFLGLGLIACGDLDDISAVDNHELAADNDNTDNTLEVDSHDLAVDNDDTPEADDQEPAANNDEILEADDQEPAANNDETLEADDQEPAANNDEILEADDQEVVANDDASAVGNHDLVGEWEWGHTGIWYRFYEDGSAVNVKDGEQFTWSADGSLNDAIFYESWIIHNGILTITWNRGVSFNYTRAE